MPANSAAVLISVTAAACTMISALCTADCGPASCSASSVFSVSSGTSGTSGVSGASGVFDPSCSSGSFGTAASSVRGCSTAVLAAASTISARTEVGSTLVSISTTSSHDTTRFFIVSVSFM